MQADLPPCRLLYPRLRVAKHRNHSKTDVVGCTFDPVAQEIIRALAVAVFVLRPLLLHPGVGREPRGLVLAPLQEVRAALAAPVPRELEHDLIAADVGTSDGGDEDERAEQYSRANSALL